MEILNQYQKNGSEYAKYFANEYCDTPEPTSDDMCIFNHDLFKSLNEFQNKFLSAY